MKRFVVLSGGLASRAKAVAAGASITARISVRVPAAIVLSLALLLAPATAPMAQGGPTTTRIDFETVPGVGTPREGLAINSQYQASTGTTFSRVGGPDPVIGQIGPPRFAFNGPPNNSLPDRVVGGAVGQFFLAPGSITGFSTAEFRVTFDTPAAGVSGVVLDVDVGERWTFDALNSQGGTVDTDTVNSGDSDTGDGVATPWALAVNTNAIFSVRMSGVRGSSSGFGFGFDNFVVTRLADPVTAGPAPESAVSGKDIFDLSFLNGGDNSFPAEDEPFAGVTISTDAEIFFRPTHRVLESMPKEERKATQQELLLGSIIQGWVLAQPTESSESDTFSSPIEIPPGDWGLSPSYDYEPSNDPPDLNDALDSQDTSDMDDAIESVIPELEFFVTPS